MWRVVAKGGVTVRLELVPYIYNIEHLFPAVLYVQYDASYPTQSIHLCPCGCGMPVPLPLQGAPFPVARWHMIQSSSGPTLTPSIESPSRCRSRYWIILGCVSWAH